MTLKTTYHRYSKMITQLSIRDPWVQEFLWKYLIPSDVRHDYTKVDAIKYIHDQVLTGEQFLIGDKEAGVIFRCVVRNSKVIEPHVVGNGLRLRSVGKACIPFAWETGAEKIVAWATHPTLSKLWQQLGFTLDAVLPRYHLEDGVLKDIYILSLERPTNAL